MINNTEIQSVPTNIITGFLGVGKTSTILHLLKHKPVTERWAVLVNEFGEIGIDGGLIEGQASDDKVFIREVPGGCMCCASGVPMQVALNQLLSNAKPDRLLIEPTGLGHPKEVLQVLSSEHYSKVLSLQKTITLVDARKLSDERYTNHDTFNQQIAIADTVVGNKSDQYNTVDRDGLLNYVQHIAGESTSVLFAEYGDINPNDLEGDTSRLLQQKTEHHHGHHHESSSDNKTLFSEKPLPECGFIKAVNEGEGFHSIGWRFSPQYIFDKDKLADFMLNAKAERIKTVFVTKEGSVGLNLADDILTESELAGIDESRIEIISSELDSELESKLMECFTVIT